MVGKGTCRAAGPCGLSEHRDASVDSGSLILVCPRCASAGSFGKGAGKSICPTGSGEERGVPATCATAEGIGLAQTSVPTHTDIW